MRKLLLSICIIISINCFATEREPVFIDSSASYVVKYYKGGDIDVIFTAPKEYPYGYTLIVYCNDRPIRIQYAGKLKHGQKYLMQLNIFK